MKKYLLLLLGAALWSSSCKKTRWTSMDDLPPITDTGANTFGCMVNGELFKPKWAPGYLYSQPLKFNYQMVGSQRVFSLAATNMAMERSMVINVLGIDLSGDTSFVFDSPYADFGASARFGSNAQAGPYRYNTYKYCAGELHLFHLYKGNSRAAGTFWFDAVDTLTNDTVRVRDGRFDIGY